MTMHGRARVTALLLVAAACSPSQPDDANVARGRGLKRANVEPRAEAAMIDAATRAAFDVGPGLVLMLHPRRLARQAGYEGGDAVPADVLTALRALGAVRGTCEPMRDAPRNTPRCNVRDAGYVIRTSEPLRAAGDTAQLYFAAERFGPATGTRPEALRFEKVYQLVGTGTSWRVVREARVKTE